ncbi:hypothetical protein ACYJ2U_001781 [Clostridium botulinum]
MRTPYLVIFNNCKSCVYTDKRKIKNIFKQNKEVKIYVFKIIDSSNYWKDVYELKENNKEVKIKMFENDGYTYSEMGCYIMENVAKAEWNSNIKYPDNGWYICSICGDITNEIDDCWYCEESVCWNCASEAVDNSFEEGKFCSYECYRKYCEQEYNILYNPEEEYKEQVCDRLERILNCFDKNEIINILLYIKKSIYEIYSNDELKEKRLEYEKLSEKELLNTLNTEYSEDIYEALMKLYREKTDDELGFILDGEAFVNSLDPNDPADQWFFED